MGHEIICSISERTLDILLNMLAKLQTTIRDGYGIVEASQSMN